MNVVAIPVVLRKHRKYGIQVHTQTRRVLDPKYDSLYDNTEETCGETAKDWEDIINCCLRGCQEEMGQKDLPVVKIIGNDAEYFFTKSGKDKILGFKPYYFVQQLQGPQPWFGPCFVVVVPEDFEPQLDEEGEVTAYRWWNPKDLLKELQENPANFMGLHYPALLQVCKDIVENKLII